MKAMSSTRRDLCKKARQALAASILATCIMTLASTAFGQDAEPIPGREAVVREEYTTGFGLAFDNDLFAMKDDDLDYTFGSVVTFAGRRAVESRVSLDAVLNPLDRLVPSARSEPSPVNVYHSLQFALIAFTPDDLNVAEPIFDDRPYASFVGAANVRTFVAEPMGPVYETSFAVGILGLDLAKALQRGLHEALDLDEIPAGWGHQISDGGEPTFRFGWGRQALLATSDSARQASSDIKWRVETNVGYITEASLALSARWGRIDTPWWSLSPERNAYLSQASPIVSNGDGRGGRRELYVWGGAKMRFRAYNVFLQGQFRDSAVKFSSNDVERAVLEAWFGVTYELPRGMRLSYVSRYQSAEIKVGRGNRDMRWAGFVISRATGGVL
jgi:hypothetical protein